MLHMKYNSNIYYFQLPEKLKTHDYTIFFSYKHLGKIFYKKPYFYAFCGTYKYASIYFKIITHPKNSVFCV